MSTVGWGLRPRRWSGALRPWMAARGPASSLAHGHTTAQRVAYWVRRWKRRLGQGVMDAMDRTVQTRLIASCGAAAATLGEF